MASLLERLMRQAAEVGVDVRRLGAALRRVPWFVSTVRAYQRAEPDPAFPLSLDRLRPALGDRDGDAAALDSHYFHQDLWAARKIFAARPARHVDLGSRIDGFVAHLLTFMPVVVVDVRPLPVAIDGLTFVQADATDLRAFDDASIESLSCLHAIEHFGLGRYGDPIAPNAWHRGLCSLSRVLRPGGRLYLSTPVGEQRLEFNAHRVFSPRTLLDAVPDLRLVSFAAVDDEGRFRPEADPADFEGARYACGMFELTK
jgi:SAM-dependent methyltransferase